MGINYAIMGTYTTTDQSLKTSENTFLCIRGPITNLFLFSRLKMHTGRHAHEQSYTVCYMHVCHTVLTLAH